MIHLRRVTINNFKQLQDIDLLLPRCGRFLVTGLNEAGKSTLFEAIFLGLFGQPLATETAHARLDDVIRYDTDEALVDLETELSDGRLMRVTRRVRRDRPNVWQLEFVSADGTVEEVRGNSVVNQRIEDELGFDGDALLNTCFVEQKKLEKLEGLNRAQREESLMKLLNLDRLLELETSLKVRPADQAQLTRLRGRAELARLQTMLPTLEARHAEVALALARLEARQVLEAAVVDMAALDDLSAKLTEARAREKALTEQAKTAERHAAGLVRLREARTARDRALEAAATVRQLETQIAVARRAGEEEEPAVLRRGRRLARLKSRLGFLQSLAEERTAFDRRVAETDESLAGVAKDREALNALRQRLVEVRAAVRDADSHREALESDLRAFGVQQVLGDWVRARTALDSLPDAPSALAGTRAARDAAVRGGRIQLAVLGVATLALLIGSIYVRYLGAGAAVGLVLLWWRWLQLSARETRLTEELGRLEGQVTLRRQEAEVLAARLATATNRLSELNVVMPGDLGRARGALEEIEGRLADRAQGEVETALGEVRATLARATVEVETLERHEAEKRQAVGRLDAAALGRERDSWVARTGRINALLARREPRLAATADELAVDLTAGAIEHELGGLRVELTAARERARRLPELERERAAQQQGAEQYWSAVATAWADLPRVDGFPEWSRDLADGEWDAVQVAIRTAYEAAGGDEVRRALEGATRRAAGLAAEEQAARRALAGRVDELRRGLAGLDLNVSLPASPTRDDLDSALAALAPHTTGDPAALAAERDRLRERVNVVRHDIRRLEGELGLRGEVLDLAVATAEYEAVERELAVRERAAAMVGHAGRNVMRGILPSTIAHMRRLLPALTDDRYFDAQLTEDYRIAVFDERAGDWKQKNIFSGGTRDQFSLALRLAFALATLPDERGTAPSFLFLDEPLGAFDSERARALVQLLTEGEIARSFDQIFLISHVRVDAAQFDYRITLAAGRVVESELGDEPE